MHLHPLRLPNRGNGRRLEEQDHGESGRFRDTRWCYVRYCCLGYELLSSGLPIQAIICHAQGREDGTRGGDVVMALTYWDKETRNLEAEFVFV
jgi:hypothetical protein